MRAPGRIEHRLIIGEFNSYKKRFSSVPAILSRLAHIISLSGEEAMTGSKFENDSYDDIYLDFEGALDVMRSMGFKSATLRKVRRWADNGVLPFFGELGPRHISVSTLRARVRKMQTDAERGQRSC